MSSNLKPITVWGQGGPNPPKVAIILSELSLPHTIIPLPFSSVKSPEYTAINPNGRLPSIQDPNTDITLWESGAIIEYLIETYDTEQKISFKRGTKEYWHAKQWLFFQTTGQAPYFGQLSWFRKFHAEKLPSAIERYAKEVNRVSGVLETWLAAQKEEFGGEKYEGDGPWLVGNKLSYADLAFLSWQKIVLAICEKEDYVESDYPLLSEWLGKMYVRPNVEKVRNAGDMKW
jgi:glutathione S-transferase